MASIRKRGGKYQVQVALKGYKRSATFGLKADGNLWAKRVEAEIERAVAAGVEPEWCRETPASADSPEYPTVREALDRYAADVASRKQEGKSESDRIRALQKRTITDHRMDQLRPHKVAEYRDQRLQKVKPNTVRLDLATLRHLYNVAAREWGYEDLDNPVAKVSTPQPRGRRDRRLSPKEEEALIRECGSSRNLFLLPALLLSLEMAVRRIELIRMRWSQVDLGNRVAWLVDGQSKNDDYRALPLTKMAIRTLETIPREEGDDRVIQTTYKSLVNSWKSARCRAEVSDYRWHDLRHEATSRLFEAGLGLMEAASVTGHRNPQMLKRYTHLQPSELAGKLDRARETGGE